MSEPFDNPELCPDSGIIRRNSGNIKQKNQKNDFHVREKSARKTNRFLTFLTGQTFDDRYWANNFDKLLWLKKLYDI